jgi:hypothetical protein
MQASNRGRDVSTAGVGRMDYAIEGIDSSHAPIHGRLSSFTSLFRENTELGGGFNEDERVNLIATILGLVSKERHENHPDLVSTLNDPEFDVPGGEEGRPYWLESTQVIRETLLQLNGCDLRARLCRCWFGNNEDGSVSLDVTVHLPGVHACVCEGDEVNQGALAVMKLEDGTFQASVSPRIYRIVCANGLGRFDRLGHASWSETPTVKSIRDVLETRLRGCLLDSESFHRDVDELRQSDAELVTDPEELLRWAERKAVVVLERSDRFRVLRRFSRSDRQTRWNLLNAITAQAHHAPDAKSARDLELLGAAVAKHRRDSCNSELGSGELQHARDEARAYLRECQAWPRLDIHPHNPESTGIGSALTSQTTSQGVIFWGNTSRHPLIRRQRSAVRSRSSAPIDWRP